MNSPPAAASAAELLRARIGRNVVAPRDAGWDGARQAWNLAVDQRPALVVLATSVDDIVATVQAAGATGLRVAAQGTGHNAAPLGDLSDTILLKTSGLRGVEIEPETRRARFEAGVLAGEVAQATAQHGLVGAIGTSPNVGVVGYTLGGGAGFLGRKHGLAAGAVVAVELVLADGRPVRATADTEPDLFWAVRGGGGSFGIVAAIEVALFPHDELYAGALFFAIDRAEEIVDAWRGWTTTAPEEITTIARLMNFPPLPAVPEPVRGRSFVVIDGAHAGDEAAGTRAIAALRELGPQMDTCATIPASALTQIHMDPPAPTPSIGDGTLLDGLDTAAIRAIVDVAGPGSNSPLLAVELRHLGGAFARSGDPPGADTAIEQPYLLYAVGIPTPEVEDAIHTRLHEVVGAVRPWDSGRSLLNFVERRADPSRMWPAGVLARLRTVKARYDPRDIIRANHPVAPERRATRESPAQAQRPRQDSNLQPRD